MSFRKTAGIAAALMLSGSYSAMAATLAVTAATTIAQESIVGAATTTPASTITVTSVGGYSSTQMLLSFTLTGAVFDTARTSASLTGCGTSRGVQSGGLAGTSTVTFTIDGAAIGPGIVCTFHPGAVRGLAAGTNVTVASTLTLASSGAIVDNGIATGNGATVVTIADANKGSLGAPSTAVLNLAGGAVGFVAAAGPPVVTATTFQSGNMFDLVHQTAGLAATPATLFKTGELAATGVLTLSGIPSAVVAAPTLTFNGGAQAGGTCTAPAAGTSTCTLDNAALLAVNGSATAAAPTNAIVATFTVNGTTVIAPSTVNGKLVVTYTGGQAPETLFDGTIASVGTTACAAEFGSMLGKATTNALTTIRLSNTSGTAGKVYVTATDDKGAHSAVVQVTKTNGGASAVNVLDANNLLPAGATVELTGGDIETATLNFASWSGTTRGRARVFVETAGSATAGSLGGGKGCKAEAWLCVGTGCTIINQTGDGVDGITPAAQKN